MCSLFLSFFDSGHSFMKLPVNILWLYCPRARERISDQGHNEYTNIYREVKAWKLYPTQGTLVWHVPKQLSLLTMNSQRLIEEKSCDYDGLEV